MAFKKILVAVDGSETAEYALESVTGLAQKLNAELILLAVTGSHIEGVNNRGTYRLPEGEPEIRHEHIDESLLILGETGAGKEVVARNMSWISGTVDVSFRRK